MEEDDAETMELLLQLKELRCARLQALISLKEARLKEARLAEARLKTSPGAPTSPEEKKENAAPASVLRRNVSSLVNVETVGQNTNPLGKLQPLGRREFR